MSPALTQYPRAISTCKSAVRHTLQLAAAALLSCGVAHGDENSPAVPAPLGLYVRGGVLMREGRPYRGIGANYFSLFARVLKSPDDDSPLKNLTALGDAGVPFVRFMCGGFWPVEMRLYQDNQAEYFRRLDKVVGAAKDAKVGLIPSLFWNPSTVADLCGEHLDQYANPFFPRPPVRPPALSTAFTGKAIS